VLAALVVLSLILLTAYFGEAPGGRLHSVQRGFLTVLAPVQEGASKAIAPVRNFFNGIGQTLHARGELAEYRKQVDILHQELVTAQLAARHADQSAKIGHLDTSLDLTRYDPLNADVIAQDPTLWYSTVIIDKGSDAGVRVNDPVIDEDGLVGRVSLVDPFDAQVTLLTDQSMGVAAEDAASGARGILVPEVGNPETLELTYVAANAPVNTGDYVVTSGTVAPQYPSLYPRGLPIGQVTSVNDSNLQQAVNVRPLANLRELDTVQVLAQPDGASTQAISDLPPAGSEPGGAATANAQVNTAGSGG